MKRLIVSLVTALAIVLSPVLAAANPALWQITLSDPAEKSNSNVVQLSYNVLSAVKTDTFTVDLYEDADSDTLLETQSVTTPNGNSGLFEVTVTESGVYSYYIKVTNSNGDAPKTSDSVITEYIDATPVVVQASTDGTTDGNGAGGATADSDGQTGDGAATDADDGNVAGTEDESDGENGAAKYNRATSIVGALAILLLIYLLYRARRADDQL